MYMNDEIFLDDIYEFKKQYVKNKKIWDIESKY